MFFLQKSQVFLLFQVDFIKNCDAHPQNIPSQQINPVKMTRFHKKKLEVEFSPNMLPFTNCVFSNGVFFTEVINAKWQLLIFDTNLIQYII